MIYLSICATLFVMIAANYLLAKVKQESLGAVSKWTSYLVLLIASLILVCQLAQGVMRMACRGKGECRTEEKVMIREMGPGGCMMMGHGPGGCEVGRGCMGHPGCGHEGMGAECKGACDHQCGDKCMDKCGDKCKGEMEHHCGGMEMKGECMHHDSTAKK